MSDGRRLRIIFLNDSYIEIPVQPRLTVNELRDIVASHANIQDRHYFALAYRDTNGFYFWLNPDKRVLDHDICSSKKPAALYFLIKYFEESHALISDINIFEQLYFQAKRQLSSGELECSPKDLFHLTGLILQMTHGDYKDDVSALADMKKLKPFPTRIFESHPSLEYCENQVLDYYRSNSGIDRGEAMMDFLAAVETLPCYGYHYYEVYDDKKVPWWLAFNCSGIHIFDHADKEKPRKMYCWHQTNELSSSRQKITLEVSEPRRRSASVSRRTIANMSSNCTYRTYHYFAPNATKAKMIVVMGNDQRKFFTQRRLGGSNPQPIGFRQDVAFTMNQRTNSFSRKHSFVISRTDSERKQSISSSDATDHQSSRVYDIRLNMTKDAIKEKRTELLQKRNVLCEQLLAKENEMKRLFEEEFAITGIMPEEYRLVTSDKDREIKQTAYMLSPNLMRRMTRTDNNESLEHSLTHLEMELSLLKQIYAVNKEKARQTRKKEYRLACKKDLMKLKQLQTEIDHLRCLPGLRQRPSLPGWLGNRVSDLSLSLPGSSDAGSAKNSATAIGTDDSTGDSISLNSTSSVDTGSSGKHVSSTRSIPEDILESPLKTSGDFLTENNLDHCPTTTSAQFGLTQQSSSTPQSYLKSNCYMGACQNPANAARFRYRELMLFSGITPLSSNVTQPCSQIDNDSSMLSYDAYSNIETTPTPVATVSSQSDNCKMTSQVKSSLSFNDSGFLSIVNKNDWSPPSPRRQSDGTLTRAATESETLPPNNHQSSISSNRHSLSEHDIRCQQNNNNNNNNTVRSCAEIFTFDLSLQQYSTNSETEPSSRRRKYGRPFGPSIGGGPCESVLSK